jgi:putative transcriptional regulator
LLENRVGKILIAHPNLPQGNPFEKAVIYIYQDDSQGTFGLVINKPTQWTMEQVCADRNLDYFGPTRLLHYGGPVNTGALCLIHSDDWESSNTVNIKNGISLSSDSFMIEKIGSASLPAYWRMCVGICAWQPGQLDMELKGAPPYRPENSWLLANATDSILFDYDNEMQWKKAVELSSRQMINQYF